MVKTTASRSGKATGMPKNRVSLRFTKGEVMVNLMVVNKFSGYHNATVRAKLEDWSGESFWVQVLIGGLPATMARRSLIEI
jgi:hypothetical protein